MSDSVVMLTLFDEGSDSYMDDDAGKLFPYPCDRGLEIRLDCIVWVADAPYGS